MESIKLHIGCGEKNFGSDWIHIDIKKYPHVVSTDARKLAYGDNEIDLIYASHVLEHFERGEGIKVLFEWHRVLKKSGILRLAVPDFKQITQCYISGRFRLDQMLGLLYGGHNNQYDYHHTAYDYHDLKYLLKHDIGFKQVRLWDWRKTEHSKFDDYSQAYLPHMDKENGNLMSLNIEAIK